MTFVFPLGKISRATAGNDANAKKGDELPISGNHINMEPIIADLEEDDNE